MSEICTHCSLFFKGLVVLVMLFAIALVIKKVLCSCSESAWFVLTVLYMNCLLGEVILVKLSFKIETFKFNVA